MTQSNPLFATTDCANLTRLLVDLVGFPEIEDEDGVSFSSMDLIKHTSFAYGPFKNDTIPVN